MTSILRLELHGCYGLCALLFCTLFGCKCAAIADRCLNLPCRNGGTCLTEANKYQCVCMNGWSGVNCTENIDDCAAQPCYNGGTCIDRVGSYFCKCPMGKTGLRCQLEDKCVSNPCYKGANCDTSPIDGSYTCTCPPGRNGTNCSEDIDECVETALPPCEKEGTCLNTFGSFKCNCQNGFSGPRCEVNINECLSSPCRNNGTCLDRAGMFTCLCMDGYTGSTCDKEIQTCRTNPCQHGGSCTDHHLTGFICECPQGFYGERCADDVDECVASSVNRCPNGGTCLNTVGSFSCSCPAGYYGEKCERNAPECISDRCENGGTCADGLNGCLCVPGFSGYHCEFDIDECLSSPCRNGATCHNYVNSYNCTCAPGFSGTNCDIDNNNCSSSLCLNGGICDSHPCLNDGTCEVFGNTYRCICAAGWTGQKCNSLIDLCSQSEPVCKNGGTCRMNGNMFECSCTLGWTGRQCDVTNVSCAVEAYNRGMNESALCQNGGTCHNYDSTHYCACSSGYEGSYCEKKTDQSLSLPCPNGANCSSVNSGFSGKNCTVIANEFHSNPCQNNGTCHNLINGFRCSCRPGTSGTHCEENLNDCLPQGLCLHGGTCIDKINGYDCVCQPGWVGVDCSKYIGHCSGETNPCQNGGRCMDSGGPSRFTCTCLLGFTGPYCQNSACESNPCQNRGHCSIVNGHFKCQCHQGYEGITCNRVTNRSDVCVVNGCSYKAGNGICDPECDEYVCQFDGYDCSYKSNIYKNCKAIHNGIPCYALINNSRCDSECNNEGCLYDGWDCKTSAVCNYDAYCKSHYRDGSCDQGCNSEECGWDGLDCVENKGPKYADGILVIVVLVPVKVFVKNSAEFLRNISLQLHGTLVIMKDENGKDMIYSWPNADDRYLEKQKRSIVVTVLPGDYGRSAKSGTKFYAKLDNTYCQAQCFPDAELAAGFIALLMRQGFSPGYKLYSVGSEPDSPSPPAPQIPVVVAMISIVVVIAIIAVITTELRKRGYGKTWFPEGFCLLPLTHNGHSKQGSTKVTSSSSSSDSTPGSTAESVTSWSDDESYHSKAKRLKSEKQDSREWTRMHLEAAGRIPKPAILPFTPPQNDQHEMRDINVRGPGGLTPLMLASMASSEMPCMGYEGCSGTSVITELINDGASIHCKTDHTGEAPLHLAARYSRSDAAKRLLDAGADPNVTDNLGRTPLHAAVTADAIGVFQILLRHRMTIVNVRMKDGTTPLILAVRLAVEGMVEELLNAEADVGAADDLGKTALHWAAAVNNVTAALLLLQHGANKDAQDDHNQTPLYVAAREGSRDVVLLLLQNSASVDIPDHVERLPRDIALERRHHDIVQLFDNYSFNLANDGADGAIVSSYVAHGPKNKQKRPQHKKQRPVKEIELHSIDHCIQFPSHVSTQFVHLPLENAKKQKKRSAAPRFAGPPARGCIRTTVHGNRMEPLNRLMDYHPPSCDQPCLGQMGHCVAQAALPSLSGALLDALDYTGIYQHTGVVFGSDGAQEQAYSWYSSDKNPGLFAVGRAADAQWFGHVSSTVPKTEEFGSFGDGVLCRPQGHSYGEQAVGLDALDSKGFVAFQSQNGTLNQNFQYDNTNNHASVHRLLDDHEPPYSPANKLISFENQYFCPSSAQPSSNAAVLNDSGSVLPSMSTCSKTSAVAVHEIDPTSNGAMINTSALLGNSRSTAVQSFLHPIVKCLPDDCDPHAIEKKSLEHVMKPLPQYPFPQQGAQSWLAEAALTAPVGTMDDTRSGSQKLSFPTPPSQHFQQSDTPPQQLASFLPCELYPTPSPDSLGSWSNSPSQSVKSNWSDRVIIHSPRHPAGLKVTQTIVGVKEEPSFFV